MDRSGTPTQAATITAHKPRYFEENLNRQGDCVAAEALPSEVAIKSRGSRTDRLFLPDRPLELNFAMRPAGPSREGWWTSRGCRWSGTPWRSPGLTFHRHRA